MNFHPYLNPNTHRKVAVVGNYLPRQCGIASFTTDLVRSISESTTIAGVDVIAMIDEAGAMYPEVVKLQIMASELTEYQAAAEFLNAGGYEVLSVQHEYGIFGGEAGSYLLTMLRAVKMPIVTTLHTVLRDPTPAQWTVTSELLQLSEKVVVMSELAADILKDVYELPADRIDFIPHGIPDFSAESTGHIKRDLGITGPMILTFGLLSPDKGVQYMIEAMPQILAKSPGAVYVVLGATHPKVKAEVGERYRNSLESLVETLNIGESVRFVNRFVSQDELVEYLTEADVYVTPYLNPQQITSGTLAYALGAGKAVVSTPYLYAKELLADGRGLLVPFRDADAIATAINQLQTADELKGAMRQRASAYGHAMEWPQIGKRYAATFANAVQGSASNLEQLTEFRTANTRSYPLPTFPTKHLFALTDDTGIYQHSIYTVPNRSHGYCVDDNARALLLTAYREAHNELTPELLRLQARYLSFVHDSFNPDNGRFRNFMSWSRAWLEAMGSDDSHARTMWALGAVVHHSRKEPHQKLSRELFHLAIPAMYGIGSPRSWAYGVLACEEFLSSSSADHQANVLMQEMANRLLRAYRANRSADWCWFEDVVTYANARMSQAMILAGRRLGNREMVECGMESLSWLMGLQHNERGDFRPIGSNGFLRRGQAPAQFDQQPLEAWVSISACITAAQATSNLAWIGQARRAMEWFLGRNDLSLSLYDPGSGGCRDAMHVDRLNENQGAESTLAFLCALTEMQAALANSTVAQTTVPSK